MKLIENTIMTVSPDTIVLLEYIGVIFLVISTVYISLLTGGSIMSFIFNRAGEFKKNEKYLRLSRDFIRITSVNKSAAFLLGILPLAGLFFILIQILTGTGSSAGEYLLYSIILLSAAVILIFTYRFNFVLTDLINKIAPLSSEQEARLEHDLESEYKKYQKTSKTFFVRSGFWGLLLMLAGSLLLSAAYTLITQPQMWQQSITIAAVFSSIPVYVNWIYFLMISVASTNAFVFFNFYFWQGGLRDLTGDYSSFATKSLLFTITTIILTIPFIVVLALVFLPAEVVSLTVFVLVSFILAIIFVLVHLLYDMIKNKHYRFAGWIFTLLLFIYLFSSIAGYSMLRYSAKEQTAKLEQEYRQQQDNA